MIYILYFIFIFTSYFVSGDEYFLKREYSLSKSLAGSWETYGTTVMTNEYVRLTSNHQSQLGGIYNRIPNDIRDFEVHLSFKVHGSEGSLFGDGMAFWYTATPARPGDVFGNINQFKGLGIFLDTYSNHNGPHHHDHPYISAMINNGSLKYDHDSDGTHTQLAGCSAHFRNKGHDTLLAIRYERNKLTVSHDINNDGKWVECFSVPDVMLPLGYFFGLSAATGDLADNHDVTNIKVYELEVDHSNEDSSVDLYKIEPFAAHPEPTREHTEDEKPSTVWKVFKWIFYILVFVACCVGLVVSYYMYRQNEEKRKRLY